MPRPVPKTPSRRAPPGSKRRRRPKVTRRSPPPAHATRKQRLTRAAKAAIATTGVIVTGAIAAGAVHQHRSRRVRQLLQEQADFGIPKRARSPSGWRSVIDILNRVKIPNDTNRTHFKKQCLAQGGLFVSAYNSMLELLEYEHDKNTAPIGAEELTLVRLFILKQTIFNTVAIDALEKFTNIYDNDKITDRFEICAWAMALEHLRNERLSREVSGIAIAHPRV